MLVGGVGSSMEGGRGIGINMGVMGEDMGG